MAAELAEGWLLPLLFTGLGLAVGSFLSSAFLVHFRPTWLFSALKVVSKPAPAHGSGNAREACVSLINDNRKKEKRNEKLSDMCQRQVEATLAAFADVTKEEQSKKSSDALSDLSFGTLGLADDCSQSSAQGSHNNIKPDPYSISKRQGYLSWDDYFMAIAFLSAHRSKDPNRQVGACLVSQDRVILGIGYNGFPRGCSDDELPWAKVSMNGDPLQTKYPYVCHAEVNAILNKNHASACGQRLYVTMFPCNECAKIIIQAGVAEVVYFTGKTSSSDCSYVASRKLLSMAGIKVWQHQPQQEKLILDFK